MPVQSDPSTVFRVRVNVLTCYAFLLIKTKASIFGFNGSAHFFLPFPFSDNGRTDVRKKGRPFHALHASGLLMRRLRALHAVVHVLRSV